MSNREQAKQSYIDPNTGNLQTHLPTMVGKLVEQHFEFETTRTIKPMVANKGGRLALRSLAKIPRERFLIDG